MKKLFYDLIGNSESNKSFLSFSNLFSIISVSFGGFVSFLMIVILAKTTAYLLNFTSSINLGSIDIQISILGAGMQLSIFLLKKADRIKKNS